MTEIIIAILLQLATLNGANSNISGKSDTSKEKDKQEETTKKKTGGVGDWKEAPGK